MLVPRTGQQMPGVRCAKLPPYSNPDGQPRLPTDQNHPCKDSRGTHSHLLSCLPSPLSSQNNKVKVIAAEAAITEKSTRGAEPSPCTPGRAHQHYLLKACEREPPRGRVEGAAARPLLAHTPGTVERTIAEEAERSSHPSSVPLGRR